MNRFIKVLTLAGVCTCAPSFAHAATIDFDYTIVVNLVQGSTTGVLGRTYSIGDTLHGHLRIDASLTDRDPHPNWGSYVDWSQGPSFMSLDTETPFVGDDVMDVAVTAFPPGGTAADTLWAASRKTLANGTAAFITLSITNLHDLSLDLWSSDALPQTGLPSSSLGPLSIVFVETPTGLVQGRLTAFDRVESDPPNTVPEPTSLMLLGTGLVGATRFRRGTRP